MPQDASMPATISPAVRLPAACARALGTAVLALSLFVFVLALPPFAFGIWFQTEPVTAGLLACGAAAGLCLLALDLTGHPVALLFGRRHVQILLAFLAWNALVSIAQDFPGRSWFGTPETGEGIFSFLALLLLMLLGMALWPYRLSRRLLAAAAVMAALTLAGLDCLLPWESAWRPAKFAGYAGTVGPPLVLIVLGAWRRFGWRTVGLAALAGLVPIVFSGNKTAIVLSCLAGPVAGLAVALVLRFLPVVRARWYLAWAPIAALVLTCAAIDRKSVV